MSDAADALTQHARRAAAQYRELFGEYQACARRIEDLLTAWLDAESINYLVVSARAKSVDSFRAKAARVGGEGSTPRYALPLTDITDLIGARVITYLPESVERTCEILRSEFDVREDVDKGQRTKQQGGFGYASRHFLVTLDTQRASSLEYTRLKDKTFEIQVRTAAQHAWAEFEHDIRYKVSIPDARKAEFDRRFTLAAALMELADNEFTEIDRLYREVAQQAADRADERPVQRSRPTAPRAPLGLQERESTASLDPAELATWLTERYREAPRAKKEHYLAMIDALRQCEISSLAALQRTLDDVDSDQVNQAMQHVIAAGQVRRLEDDLLAALGTTYIARTAHDDDRKALLTRRLTKLR